MARPPAGGLCLLIFFTAAHPPPRGSSMAGQFSGAGERLPIRHGVGGFAANSTPPFTLRSFYFTAGAFIRRVQVHSACARFAAGRIFFLGFGGFWVHEPGCVVKAELPLPRLCLGDVPNGAHKDEERRLERGALKQRRKQEANPRAKHRPAGPATRTKQRVAKDQQ